MFVSGPVGTSVSAPLPLPDLPRQESTACSFTGRPAGGGRSGPSRPVSPCTCAATSRARTSGSAAPSATGTSPRPQSSSTRSAFAVVLSSVWLPETVVTPTSSSSGDATASISAKASSCPGSQSMTIGVVFTVDGLEPCREPVAGRQRGLRAERSGGIGPGHDRPVEGLVVGLPLEQPDRRARP